MAGFEAAPQQSGEPPLEWPWYGIGFGAAIARFFKKYATFTGRASRGEYWWYALFGAIISVVLYVILFATLIPTFIAAQTTGTAPRFGAGYFAISGIAGLWGLATLIPGIALAVRRLHDTGRSGWNYLFGLIPVAGPIILLVFFVGQTTSTADRYGPPASQGGYGSYGGQQAYPPAQGYTT